MTKRNPLPSAETLHSLFTYELDTGLLRWKVDRAAKKAGDVAGSTSERYVLVGIDYKIYRAHLIIWKMMTGEEPPHEIDHHDTIKTNNKWENLRPATKSQNMANVGLIGSNTTGAKGVFWYKAYKKWSVQVWKDKKGHFGGYHETFEAACTAAQALRQTLFGEFARAA